jgi:hypothetical protein
MYSSFRTFRRKTLEKFLGQVTPVIRRRQVDPSRKPMQKIWGKALDLLGNGGKKVAPLGGASRSEWIGHEPMGQKSKELPGQTTQLIISPMMCA